MKAERVIVIVIFVAFLSGCFAIVDERGDERKIKSLIITSEETNELLDKVEQEEPHSEYDLRPFRSPKDNE